MHITLVNAEDRYECVWRGVLATSFQDIVSEEKELLFLRHGRPEMLANQMLSFAFYAGGKEKEGLHTLKNSLTRHLALKNKVLLGLQEFRTAFNHIHFE